MKFEDACNRALVALEELDGDERWQAAAVVALAVADRCDVPMTVLLANIADCARRAAEPATLFGAAPERGDA